MSKKNKITTNNKPTYIFQDLYDQIKGYYSNMNLAELNFEIAHRPGILQNPISSNYDCMLREILNGLIREKKITIAGGTIGNR